MDILDLHLGRPVVRGALTVFPVWNGAAVAARGYDLGSAALGVEERTNAAVVGELVVTNTGPRPALLLEGELLQGGQQHRVASRSVVIDSGASQVIEVRCVEEGRWSGGRAHARTGHRAPVSVRAAQGQHTTWQRVRDLESRHGGGDTHFLGDTLVGVEERATALVADLAPLSFQTGVLWCVAGQPIQLEVFDSPRTLAAVWKALLRAAAVDALDAAPIPTPGRRARRFLDRVRQLSTAAGTPGHNRPDRRTSQYAGLAALSWRGRTVHAVATNTRHELLISA